MPTSRTPQDSVDKQLPAQPDAHKPHSKSSLKAPQVTSEDKHYGVRSNRILPGKPTHDLSSASRPAHTPSSDPRAISQDGTRALYYLDARTPTQPVFSSPDPRHSSGSSISPRALRAHHYNHSVSSYGSSPGSPNHLAQAQILPRSPPLASQLPTSPRGRFAGMRRPSSEVAAAFPYAPPPHHLQAHFHSLPDPDLGISSYRIANVKPGEKQYFCGFDTLQSAGDGSYGTENVLLIGYEGGLDIYRAQSAELDIIGSLEGIRGAVIEAKIIPCCSSVDANPTSLPHVALLIHGPVSDDSADVDGFNGDPLFKGDSIYEHQPVMSAAPADQSLAYHTRLEVFSLRSRERVASLYRSQPHFASYHRSVADVHQLAAVDGLRLDVSGKFVSIVSDQSGEIFMFSRSPTGNHGITSSYRCVGKYWTSIHVAPSEQDARPTSRHDGEQQNQSERSGTRTPLFSLSARWLAIVPPVSPSSSTTNGIPFTLDATSKPTGLDSVTPPLPPQPNCIVEVLEADGMVSKFAWSAAQEILKGAKWAGNQGLQKVRSYWLNTSSAIEDHITYSPYLTGPDLPPTNAAAQLHSSSPEETATVSIIDLESLSRGSGMKQSQPHPPAWTFPVPLGCSFISFSPNGLCLLTASHNGDVQYLWSLKGLRFERTAPRLGGRHRREQGHDGGRVDSHVRQVAKFSRLTDSTIVDVVWSEPIGNKVAVITEKGTVHTFEVPSNASQWPHSASLGRNRGAKDPIQATKTIDSLDKTSTSPETVSSPWSYVSSTVSSMNDRARPILSALQSHGASTSQLTLSRLGNLTLATAGTGVKNSKAMALGVSKSIGAAAGSVNKQIRNGGEILRIRMPLGSGKIQKRCVRFMTGKDRGLIATVSGAVLRMHSIRHANSNSTSQMSSKPKVIEFVLPELPEISTYPKHSSVDDQQPLKLNGFYRPPLHLSKGGAESVTNHTTSESPHPFSFAELESCAPFQPLHTDHRVTLSTYKEPEPWDADKDLMYGPDVTEDEHWCFGAEIKSNVVCSGGRNTSIEGESIARAKIMSRTDLSRAEDGDEIVATTLKSTKRKNKQKSMNGDRHGEWGGIAEDDIDDFFEDDCEVLAF